MAFDHLVVLLKIILFVFPVKAAVQEPQCQDSCGDVNVIYPFGIGEGCYFNKWFEVSCDNTSGSPKALLTKLHLEIFNDLSFDDLSLSGLFYYASQRAVINIGKDKLHRMTKTMGSTIKSGSPFFFSTKYNMLGSFGCENYANGSISTNNFCNSFYTCDPRKERGCRDVLCKLNDGKVSPKLPHLRGCPEPALMVDQQWLQQNYLTNHSVLSKKDLLPVSMEWGSRKGTCIELYNSSITFCNKDKYCLIQLNGGDYYCVCDYQKLDGDQICTGDLICNTTRNLNCSECPKGYENSHNYQLHQMQCSSSRNLNDMLKKKSRQVTLHTIIGSCAGSGLLLLFIGPWFLYKFIKRRKEIKLKQRFFKRNGGLLLKQRLSSNNEFNIEQIKLFTSKELEKATDNYNTNRILGQGGQGTVYKGMLAQGRIVAVKKPKKVEIKKVQEFINEVVILSKINHRNVVQLLGCCLETEVPLLVFEFIPNGTLYQHIHDQNEAFPITWEMRLRIAVESASAISYLHSAASVPIYHRDIKSTNILLDDKYRAKVSDFGTSRSISYEKTHLTTQVQGTFGYLDPEYFWSSRFTEKSDVYSFGVVLTELLTGQKPIRSTDSEEDESLVAYFLRAMKENHLFEILDDRVLKEGHREDILKVATIARRCLNPNGKKRPTMIEVAIQLAGIMKACCGNMTNHLTTGNGNEMVSNTLLPLPVPILSKDTFPRP